MQSVSVEGFDCLGRTTNPANFANLSQCFTPLVSWQRLNITEY